MFTNLQQAAYYELQNYLFTGIGLLIVTKNQDKAILLLRRTIADAKGSLQSVINAERTKRNFIHGTARQRHRFQHRPTPRPALERYQARLYPAGCRPPEWVRENR